MGGLHNGCWDRQAGLRFAYRVVGRTVKGEVLDTFIVVVEGDGVAQRVQPVEVANSTRMFDGERKKKSSCAFQSPSTAVMKSAGGRRLDDVGQAVLSRTGAQKGSQGLPRSQN